jgi:hypothetical protein
MDPGFYHKSQAYKSLRRVHHSIFADWKWYAADEDVQWIDDEVQHQKMI